MSEKKFKFDYGDIKKNLSENQKCEKESFNNVRQSKKNNKVVFNDFNKTNEILLENNFDLSRQSKFNIDVGNNLRKSKSSRFDSTDYDKNGNYINKKLLNIKFTKFNDYTNESNNELVPLNSLEENYSNF
jgi:hypothetical protein